MIEVVGIPGSREFAVAKQLEASFVAQWPGIENTPEAEESIKIAANAKLSGGPVSDVDIVVAGLLNRPRFFAVRRPVKDREGNAVSGVKARVKSFVCAVEVKSQDASGVSIQGDEVNVRYNGSWKSATDQNVKQVHALKSAFENQYADCFVYRCVVLEGIDELPKIVGRVQPDAGAVAGQFSAGDFFAAMAGVYGLDRYKGEFSISSGRPEVIRKVLLAPLFREIVPSRLDRARMDRIAARRPEAAEIAAKLGTQRVHVRGHGGTGKTMIMLQAAHEAFEKYGKRILILTYNNALASDIRRSLAMMGVPSASEGGGVEVRTAMSFTYSWLARLGVSASGQHGNYEAYERECQEALDLFDAGALSRGDVQAVIDGDPDRFEFDAVIVDEAQDWPQAEARLLAAIYGGERVSIADGREQLLRGKATNWSRTLADGHVTSERTLLRCLRMKRNLGVFANAIASKAGLNWEVEPNDEAAGGRVVIVAGPYGDQPGLIEELLGAARRDGNDPVDFLHCVPASGVIEVDGHRSSRLAAKLRQAGHEAWDGVNDVTRQDFPRSCEEFRVLQYESNRGLEGWVTVLDQFDAAIEQRARLERKRLGDDDGISDLERRSRQAAWRWAMISLTRPIDTMVITLADPGNEQARIILDVARSFPDFVQVTGVAS